MLIKGFALVQCSNIIAIIMIILSLTGHSWGVLGNQLVELGFLQESETNTIVSSKKQRAFENSY